MTDEVITLKVTRYRSPEGVPTCCGDYPDGHICNFLGTAKFGTADACFYGAPAILLSRENGYGYIRPHAKCVLWADQNHVEVRKCQK